MNNESPIPMEVFGCDCSVNKARFAMEVISWQLPSFSELVKARSANTYIPNSCLDNMSLLFVLN